MSNTKSAKNSYKNLFQQTEFTLGVIIVLLFVIASVFTDNFFSMYNITNLMKQCAITGVLAVAQTFIIITGGIDISGGAITGLSCMVLALLQRDTGMNFWLTLVIAIIVSIAAGFINGIIVHDFKVPPMIATLGMSTIIRGIIKIISNALTVSGLDERILNMGNSSIFGIIPTLAIIWLLVALAIFLVLKYTIFGRNLYVIGSGINVAKLSGIKVRKMFLSVYALAGLLYGIAGIMLAARVQSALPTGGEGYDMSAIAAAVIGGASLAGGRGAIAGTLLGTILMVLINNAGVQFGLNTHVLEITSGVLIVFAVTMDMLKNRKKA
ncbi:MAG: ABC transporter permease [Epulopiscium sp.]|jgi:ribose/xylose/arabinose/galactoside ABC-type transport system permease subunit|nr:ABC transporter permease [Candidatus Epulonipiscium sp.]HOQ15886.1 ABC transporter permease [Defluviitaleaceae bacterium]HPT75882.1 ABC transporter permease [Defluviitaleaceae bacterium]